MRCALLVACILLTACSSASPAQKRPAPSPSVASPASPAPSPSPQPLQRPEPALPAPVEETAAAAAGGKLYVMGGFNAAGASLSSVYIFDGTSWTSGPRLPVAVDHPSAATLNGFVYIAGGHSNGRDSARFFRLDDDHWTELASMHFARGGHALVAAGEKLYAIGGNTSRADAGTTESFDPRTGAWSAISPMPDPRNHVSGFGTEQAACVAGGRSPTTPRVDCLLTSTATWSHTIGDMPRPASGGGAVSFPNGDVIVMGGEDASETRIIDQLAFLRGDIWISSQKMLSPRHGFQLAVLGDRAWACGGGSAPGLHPVATCTSVGDPAAS